ncbi:MAG: glutamine--fructose-6-phosphate transaminase (isomerizing) [Puniceicoccales bacterium]|jgi:glucosamine--fructose-6-phosphate aminotransferase (isomerizing)|nr:glutamine--fructose-6-phosphate transaminase (isomerizing) [Puniceicoccales bacterium]
MCGIIGYIGHRNAAQVVVEGLRRLEYRGYDSAGFATIKNEKFLCIKKIGKVNNLTEAIEKSNLTEPIGIGHTRWATHGVVSEANAHPQLSSDGLFAVVHNGIIENYAQIKKFLQGQGYTFSSETDTECLANLIAYHYHKEPASIQNKFSECVRKALLHIQGTYGLVVMCSAYPREMVAARKSSPLLVGIGEKETIVASDAAALLMYTNRAVYLKDGEIAIVSDSKFYITTILSENVDIVHQTIDWTNQDIELGHHAHYMHKEIFEQPQSIENIMRGRFSEDCSTSRFGGLAIPLHELRQVDRIVFCSCGTSWHASLVAEHLIELYARIPVEVEYASEFRYRNAPLDKNTLIFVISQSGETLDTLAALLEAKRKGFRVLGITNAVGSSIARETDGGIYQHSGPEIGVASTKAFTAQICAAAMLALYFARMRNMSFGDGMEFVNALKKLPSQVEEVLKQEDQIKEIAKKYYKYDDFLFLGRQLMFPIALEGALKLKEISYIHAEGYPSAEMKHGPISLISEKCPCCFFETQPHIVQKTLSNIQEVKARGAPVLAIVSEHCAAEIDNVDDLVQIPTSHIATSPVLAIIPVQLLAYHIALLRGCDVDRPRNLAKSVTVE